MLTSPVGWTRSLIVAALAAYLPHAAVTLYTLACVPCGHCKAASLQILPVSPGFLATGIANRYLGLRGSETIGLVAAGAASAAFIAAVAAFGRLGAAWLSGAATTAFFAGWAAAVITVHLLQM